jgi:hypothetical protein
MITVFPQGDANQNCVVNAVDLGFIRARFGQDPTVGDNWKADINRDGVINFLDLGLARQNFGRFCQ